MAIETGVPSGEPGVVMLQQVYEVRGSRIAGSWWTPESCQSSACVVFLHEGLGSVRQWKQFPARLCAASGLRGFAFDRLGHGRSDPSTAPRHANYLREEAEVWLPEVLAAAGLVCPVLFGHSDGGSIALYYAAAHPVAALVLEAAHVFVEELTLSGIRELGERWRPSGMAERSAKSHGAKAEALFQSWYTTWLSAEFRAFDMLDILPRVSCPAFVLQGDRDPYGSAAQVAAIVNGVSGAARSWLVPGSEHAPHLDNTDAVVAQAAAFLRDVLGAHHGPFI